MVVLKVGGSKVKVTDSFSGEGILVNSSPSTTVLFMVIFFLNYSNIFCSAIMNGSSDCDDVVAMMIVAVVLVIAVTITSVNNFSSGTVFAALLFFTN